MAHEGHGQQADHAAPTEPFIRPDSREGAIAGHAMGRDVTRLQIAAMTILTSLALIASVLWSAAHFNLTIGAHDVFGAVLAPGMIMTRDTPAAAMRDMAALNPDLVSYVAPPDA